MTFNLPLAVEMMASIEEARSVRAHYQGAWGMTTREVVTKHMEPIYEGKEFLGYGTCGTSMCAAGWAVTLGGYKLIWKQQDLFDDTFIAFEAMVEDKQVMISEVAAHLLGLPPLKLCSGCAEHGHPFATGGCTCRDDNPHWCYGKGFHVLFHQDNNMDDLYEEVGELAETDAEEIRALVQAKVEEYRITAFPEAVQRVCSVEPVEEAVR